MPIRIAHLSDLHYGARTFNHAIWQSVATKVRDIRPDILVVSGDFVHDPSEDDFHAAKAELDGIVADTGAELVTVAGNHDLFFTGFKNIGIRSGFYDHVINGAPDPGAGERLGFAPERRGWVANTWRRAGLALGVGRYAHLPSRRPEDRAHALREAAGGKLLIALIDSNWVASWRDTATGYVSGQDLLALDTALGATRPGHLARVAVIHHHLLPVAKTSRGTDIESFMVLQNAGDVLSVLARHKFDLVLHGHHHQGQFARIDFGPDTEEGYQIAVASAGSAALGTDKAPQENSFNVATFDDNGRLTVECHRYEGVLGPGDTPSRYPEPVESLKRRAHVRALQRHPIAARSSRFVVTVEEQGNVILRHELSLLRRTRGSAKLRELPQPVAPPEYGRLAFDPALDRASLEAGYTLVHDHGWQVRFPEPLTNGVTASFALESSLANSLTMTTWEAQERARAARNDPTPRPEDWDYEAIGAFVGYPLDELTFELSLPPSLASSPPTLWCGRRTDFPNFTPGPFGTVPLDADAAVERDPTLERLEQDRLVGNATSGTWRVRITRPLVGYSYRLRWKLPGTRPAAPVPAETLQWRETLLAIVAQDGGEPLARDVRRLLGSGSSSETSVLSLYVYDTKALAVRPVLWSGTCDEPPDWHRFHIPLGDGIAGAALKQRRMVPWTEDAAGADFVRPKPFPGLPAEMRAIVALPVIHRLEQDNPIPSPWAMIGVLSFASSDRDSQIQYLVNGPPPPQLAERITTLRGRYQSCIWKIYNELRPTAPS